VETLFAPESGLTQATDQTLDATPRSLFEVEVVRGSSIFLFGRVVGKSGNGRVVRAVRAFITRGTSGDASVLQDVSNAVARVGLTTADITVDASGGLARIRITGEAATTIDWAGAAGFTWPEMM
jgi:hypothetical protein